MTKIKPIEPTRLKRMERKQAEPFATWLAALLSIASGLMLAAALPGLLEPESLLDWIKVALIGLTGAGVSYGTTRLAIEKGALQAALGVRSAALVSVLSIALVGGGMFAATYAGFTRPQVDQLRLEAFTVEYAEYVDLQQAAARRAMQVAPIVRNAADDLAAAAQCELASGCLNESGTGGSGPVYREAELKRLAAAGALAQVEADSSNVAAALGTITALQEDVQETLNDPDLSQKDRRAGLQETISSISRSLTELEQVVPAAVLHGFAAQLQAGADILNSGEMLTALAVATLCTAGGLNIGQLTLVSRDLRGSALADTVMGTYRHLNRLRPLILQASDRVKSGGLD